MITGTRCERKRFSFSLLCLLSNMQPFIAQASPPLVDGDQTRLVINKSTFTCTTSKHIMSRIKIIHRKLIYRKHQSFTPPDLRCFVKFKERLFLLRRELSVSCQEMNISKQPGVSLNFHSLYFIFSM